LVDALDSKSSYGNIVRVQVPPSVQINPCNEIARFFCIYRIEENDKENS
jgi:hypothetical protein